MSNETDLDWLVRNVHKWPCGKHQPWCYVVTKIDGERAWASNVLSSSFPYSRVDKDQWLARRAELQNKPSWGAVPSLANWLAQDAAGSWLWHSSEPECRNGGWIGSTTRGYAAKGCVLGDWSDTLEKRPEQDEFEPFVSVEDSKEKEMKQGDGWFERGELPPVGVVCIFEPGSGSCYFNEYDLKASGKIVKIIAHTRYEHSSCDVAVFRWDLDGCFGVSTGNTQSFRPIRTERDVLIEIIKNADDTDDKIADAILAAGFSLRGK